MRSIKDLGSRPAPAVLRELFSRLRRGPTPTVQAERRQVPYWQERGWVREGENSYSGNYQTPYGAFQGWIEQDHSGHLTFFLHNPSDSIRSCGHWACFQPHSDGWFLVHMGRQPRDASS